jgi:hypothetical protein
LRQTQVTTPIQTKQAILQLFNSAGNIVASQIINSSQTAKIIATDTAGVYILQLTVNGEAHTFKITVE